MSTGPTFLIFGGNGLLGPYLRQAAAKVGEVHVSSRSSLENACDATDPDAVRAVMNRRRPDIVMHCIALTDVDGCQRNPGLADALNRQTVVNVVESMPAASKLVCFSTDQVYPGVGAPFREDEAAPVNIYGQSKLSGEGAALESENALVLRVNFFGPSRTAGRRSLSDWMIDSLRGGEVIKLFSDSLFSPLHMSALAAQSVEAAVADLRGVFNLGSRDGMSKADFGLSLARQLGLPTNRVRIVASADIPGRAPRPLDMRMRVGGFEKAMGRVLPTLLDEIARLREDGKGATP